MSETVIKIDHVTKEYRLGAIGGGTLRGDLQSWWAKVRGKEDPNVRLDDVGKSVKGNTRFLALDDVSFEVKKGEALGIIGHNGAGKSTLLKLLSRVTAPTSGTISYNGRIASMLEVGTGFHPELTGRENVYMNGAILGMTKAEISRKFDEIVSFAEMEKFIDTPVKRYSSGMYVKLAFAVAAHLDSEIMVMDEVLAVGDMKFQKKCLGKMGDAANSEGRTVLYVSHNMNTIRQLCTRCIVLDHGRLIYDGDVETAINIYMGSVGKIENEYTYSDEYHHVHTRGRKDGLTIKSSKFKNDCSSCQPGDVLNFDLVCDSKRKYSNIGFRFEVQFMDGVVVATAFSSKNVDFDANEEKTLHFSFDTTHLAPSKYRVDIIAYAHNEFGTQELIDGVYPGFYINIDENLDKTNQVTWLHQFWGHIQLHDVGTDEG